MKLIIAITTCLLTFSAQARTEYMSGYGSATDRDRHWACNSAEQDVRWDLERDCRWEAGSDLHWLSMISFGACSCFQSASSWSCDVRGSATCHIND